MSDQRFSILFVDDEVNLIASRRRAMIFHEDFFDSHYALSAAEGLEILSRHHMDVVISDMRMPVMDGAEFLEKVMRLWPDTVRIILSGYAERDSILHSFGSVHQYLSKPIPSEKLVSFLREICEWHNDITDVTLRRQITGYLHLLPSRKTLEGLCKMDSTHLRAPEIASAMISQDAVFTLRILQLANSPYFCGQHKITLLRQAIEILGMESIRSICQIFTSSVKMANAEVNSLDKEMRHALQVAILAKRIAQSAGLSPALANEAYLGGLLHDVGKWIFPGKNFAHDVHELAGSYLAKLLGLPSPLCAAIRFHFAPLELYSGSLTPAAAIHLADSMATGTLDVSLVYQLGLEAHLTTWQTLSNSTLFNTEYGGDHA